MVLAGGIALAFAGILLHPIFSLAGLAVVALAIAGWIRELRRE